MVIDNNDNSEDQGAYESPVNQNDSTNTEPDNCDLFRNNLVANDCDTLDNLSDELERDIVNDQSEDRDHYALDDLSDELNIINGQSDASDDIANNRELRDESIGSSDEESDDENEIDDGSSLVSHCYRPFIYKIMHNYKHGMESLSEEVINLVHRYLFPHERVYFTRKADRIRVTLICMINARGNEDLTYPRLRNEEYFIPSPFVKESSDVILRDSMGSLDSPYTRDVQLERAYYNIQYKNQPITKVPTSNLRTISKPSAFTLRSFIRDNAVWSNEGMWIVDPSQLVQYFKIESIEQGNLQLKSSLVEYSISTQLQTTYSSLDRNNIREDSTEETLNESSDEASDSKPDIEASNLEVSDEGGINSEVSVIESSAYESSEVDDKSTTSSDRSDDTDMSSEEEPLVKHDTTLENNENTEESSSEDELTLAQLKQLPIHDSNNEGHTSDEPEKPYQPPVMITRLLKAHRDNNRNAYLQLLSTVTREISSFHRNKLPEGPVRTDVIRRYRQRQQQKLVSKMTTLERQKYMCNKSIRDKLSLKRQRAVKYRKYDDTLLHSKSLPNPKKVFIPANLGGSSSFPDIMMIASFTHCFRALFKCSITAADLMKSLQSKQVEDIDRLASIYVAMMSILVSERVKMERNDTKLHFSHIEINEYNVTAFISAYLSPSTPIFNNDNEQNSDNEELRDNTLTADQYLTDEMKEHLNLKSVFTMKSEEHIRLLLLLSYRVMNSTKTQEFIIKSQNNASKLWKARVSKKISKDSLQTIQDNDTKLNELMNGSTSSTPMTPEQSINNNRRRSCRSNQSDRVQELERLENVAKEKVYNKIIKEQSKLKDIVNFENEFTRAMEQSKEILRVSSLGCDRNHSRYWIFAGESCLYVERGWSDIDLIFPDAVVSPIDSSDDDEFDARKKPKNRERTFPMKAAHQWFKYDTMTTIDDLITKLSPLGIRECALRDSLKDRYDTIKTMLTTEVPVSSAHGIPVDVNTWILEGFREELLEFDGNVRNCGIGCFSNTEEFQTRIYDTQTFGEMKACLIDCQSCIIFKFFKGILSKTHRKKDMVQIGNGESQAVSPMPSGSGVTETRPTSYYWGRELWKSKNCCICNSESTEYDMIICDICEKGYHTTCLRPALQAVPEGDWFCYNCKNGEQEEEEEVEIKPITTVIRKVCTVCKSTEDNNDMILCSTCPFYYHFLCHIPPLRREPRSNWRCQQCQTGVTMQRIRSRPKRSGTRSSKRILKTPKHYDSTTEEDEEGEEETFKRKINRPRAATSSRIIETEESDTEDVDIDTIDDLNLNKPAKKSFEMVPDYYDIIKNPIDLETIRNKVTGKQYDCHENFISDLSLMFDNASIYNAPDSYVGKCITPLRKLCNSLLKKSLGDEYLLADRNITKVEKVDNDIPIDITIRNNNYALKDDTNAQKSIEEEILKVEISDDDVDDDGSDDNHMLIDLEEKL